ncbi:hypothetical protein [uncultured Cohaesibacter sp.]|uniref:hypothetical protein n=1 Tax=uncultured Cohaesibacter sp. TaxID=1002546 RepID=UPI0029C8FE09|nr:hypothetical protein [uncultured Cohaesibacter sp.]
MSNKALIDELNRMEANREEFGVFGLCASALFDLCKKMASALEQHDAECEAAIYTNLPGVDFYDDWIGND